MQNLKQREVRAPSSSSSLSNTNDWHSAADAEIRTSTISKSAVIQKQTLPIYLLQPDKESAFQTTWGKLATEWNRTTTYTDLINLAKPMASLPNSFKKSRSLVMIHCAPKNGSSTLRIACSNYLERTCGIKHIQRNTLFPPKPMGYKNATILYLLIDSCPQANYFCTKGTVMPLDVPTFDDITFIHMFPFRTYDEWAVSALKQSYDRLGHKGCKKLATLMEKCEPTNLEIDLRQYSKTDLSKFKELVIRRMNEKKESHIFILYHHQDLEKVVTMLSRVYEIPILPGLDAREKSLRPEGSCDKSILQKFHECFSSQLMELD